MRIGGIRPRWRTAINVMWYWTLNTATDRTIKLTEIHKWTAKKKKRNRKPLRICRMMMLKHRIAKPPIIWLWAQNDSGVYASSNNYSFIRLAIAATVICTMYMFRAHTYARALISNITHSAAHHKTKNRRRRSKKKKNKIEKQHIIMWHRKNVVCTSYIRWWCC